MNLLLHNFSISSNKIALGGLTMNLLLRNPSIFCDKIILDMSLWTYHYT